MWVLKGITMVVLLGIGYQDLKYRAVFWWLFPMLLIVLATWACQQIGFTEMVRQAGTNSCFLGTQLLFITLYFSLRQKKWVNIFNGYFGLGDLLFLFSITVIFSLYHYLWFYISSIFIVILITVLRRFMSSKPSSKIPLAGYQALMLFALLLFSDDANAALVISDKLLYPLYRF